MLNRTRLAWRIGRRSLARHRGRSLAIILMLAMPLTVAVAFNVVITSAQVPPERIPYLYTGQSDRTLSFVSADGSHTAHQQYQQQLAALAQSGVTTDQVVAQVAVRHQLSAGDKLVVGMLYGALDWHRAEFHGRFDLVAGRLPDPAAAEVAISRAALTALNLGLGGKVNFGKGAEQTVVGELLDPRDTSQLWGITGFDVLVASESSRSAERRSEAPATVTWFSTKDVPRDVLVNAGWQITERNQVAFVKDPVLSSLVGIVWPLLALLLAFAALLAGAGFALGAAELRTEIGLLQAAGAGRHLIRAVLAAQGAICALLSLTIATCVGIGLAWLSLGPLSEAFAQIWANTPDIIWWQVGVIWVVAGVIIVGASRLATRAVARLTMSQALHPEPPLDLVPAPSRWARTVAISCGVVLALTLVLLATSKAHNLILLAALVALIGLTALRHVTAKLLGLLYRRFGVAGQIVGRSVAFAPGRLSGQIAACTAVVLVAGLLLTIYGGLTAKVTRNTLPVLPEGAAMLNTTSTAPPSLVTELQQHLGSPRAIRIDYTSLPGANGTPSGIMFLDTAGARCVRQAEPCADEHMLTDSQPVGIVSDSDLVHILGRTLTPAERTVWHSGGVLVASSELLIDGRLTLQKGRYPVEEVGFDIASVPVAVVSEQARYNGSELPNAFVRSAGAGPFISGGQTIWYFPPAQPAVPISDSAKAVADKKIFESVGAGYLAVARPSPALEAMQIITIVATGVLTLLVTVVCATTASMGLRDMAVEWAVLRRMGAPRKLIRRCALILGLVPALVAAALSLVVLGLIVPVALYSYDAPFAWGTFAIFLTGLMTAMGMTMLVSGNLVTARRMALWTHTRRG